LHRLNPMAAAVADETSTHPGDATRVHACLWTLRRMQAPSTIAGPYDRVLWQLDTAWRELQRDAPNQARLDDAALGALGPDLAGCWVALTENLGTIQYTWSSRVRDLVHELVTPAAESITATGYSAADVLNAAWMVRLEAWSGGAPLLVDFEPRADALLRAVLAVVRGDDGR
jgi:hypothetical protein